MTETLLALHDSKGVLSALWASCADDEVWMYDALTEAWKAEGESMVLHACLSCGVVRADGGAKADWSEFAGEVEEFLDAEALRAMPVAGSA
jgi:hypothetical protein